MIRKRTFRWLKIIPTTVTIGTCVGDGRIILYRRADNHGLNWSVRLKSPHAKKTPAISTLRNERTVLNQIFRFAKRKGYITDPPVIAVPSSRQNSRADIPETEWRRLYTYLRRYVKEAQDKRRYRERYYLQHYILILANSGIRVGEARHLRWRMGRPLG